MSIGVGIFVMVGATVGSVAKLGATVGGSNDKDGAVVGGSVVVVATQKEMVSLYTVPGPQQYSMQQIRPHARGSYDGEYELSPVHPGEPISTIHSEPSQLVLIPQQSSSQQG